MTGLGLIAYGGSLHSKSHLTDGTYDVVVGDWNDAALLATCSGESYAYTVTTAGPTQANAHEYVILDPLGNSGLPGALKQDAYIAKCAALKALHPGLDGIFLDNCEALGVGLQPSVPAATLVQIFAHVSAGLASHGLKWLANTGWFNSGDHRSDAGDLWMLWAKMIEPHFHRLLLENWMEASSHNPKVKRLRGTAWWQRWDGWMRCPAAVPGKLMAATYEWGGDLSFGTYARASLLVAPGSAGSVFYANESNRAGDPYGQPWTKRNPTPKVNPDNGNASL